MRLATLSIQGAELAAVASYRVLSEIPAATGGEDCQPQFEFWNFMIDISDSARDYFSKLLAQQRCRPRHTTAGDQAGHAGRRLQTGVL